jgi:hypothetical protein
MAAAVVMYHNYRAGVVLVSTSAYVIVATTSVIACFTSCWQGSLLSSPEGEAYADVDWHSRRPCQTWTSLVSGGLGAPASVIRHLFSGLWGLPVPVTPVAQEHALDAGHELQLVVHREHAVCLAPCGQYRW